MAKFDVYRTPDGWLALDCQADTLNFLTTRLAVPLVPKGDAPQPVDRLNPMFVVDGEAVMMVTQFAAALPNTELRHLVTSLATHEYEIGSALDMLISGF
ncbi:CcdB family protein [Sphingomonas aracearum]|uniref:Toxin CcdB n=1 Tax=Sphingomonas aracearum TaxID=2283317 RepID=A0A369VR34_9SPHN|nr:CcdB family protein [Sphingomonas aracearum]RDE04846.1 plasmid maintenance protein CcdB [Sphingomonas aracearum]